MLHILQVLGQGFHLNLIVVLKAPLDFLQMQYIAEILMQLDGVSNGAVRVPGEEVVDR